MKKITTLLFISVLAVVLTACGDKDENTSEKLQVITSFTLIEDIVQEIGGDLVETHNLVPVGTDPHDYDPLPDDMKAATKADILFYNGLNLEGGDSGWFARMMEATSQDWDRAIKVTDGVEPMYLTSEDGKEEEINPHAFLDPVVGITMTENVLAALSEIDPDNKETYEERAADYLKGLEEMDETYASKIAEIPEENRVLVTSERAFQYMANRYGLKEGYIWAIDTEENGSPEQMKQIVEFVRENNPPVLFVETNVDTRPMETVSDETGVEIYDAIFSDEIGKPGELGDTYMKFLQHNIDTISAGLRP